MRHVAVVLFLLMWGCARRDSPAVEALTPGTDMASFKLESLSGTRDGERLDVRAVYRGTGGEIEADLRFAIGPRTRLSAGTWRGVGGSGEVRERSVTFLGGQNGLPSVGGRFELIGGTGTALYVITVPVQEVNTTR